MIFKWGLALAFLTGTHRPGRAEWLFGTKRPLRVWFTLTVFLCTGPVYSGVGQARVLVLPCCSYHPPPALFLPPATRAVDAEQQLAPVARRLLFLCLM